MKNISRIVAALIFLNTVIATAGELAGLPIIEKTFPCASMSVVQVPISSSSRPSFMASPPPHGVTEDELKFSYADDLSDAVIVKNKACKQLMRVSACNPDSYGNNRLIIWGQGHFDILLGTSTAGKTTLIMRGCKQNPHYMNFDLDLRHFMAHDKALQKHFPVDYAAIASVMSGPFVINYIGKDLIKFKPDTTLLQEAKAKASIAKIETVGRSEASPKALVKELDFQFIRKNIFEEMIQRSCEGRSIVFDAVGPYSRASLFSNNFAASTTVWLVFCPVKELSRRLTIRNQEAHARGELSDSRDGEVFWQYTTLYRARMAPHEVILEVLKRAHVEEAFKTHLLADEGEAQRDHFLRAFGFTSPAIQEIEITSRFPYHRLLMNTASVSGHR